MRRPQDLQVLFFQQDFFIALNLSCQCTLSSSSSWTTTLKKTTLVHYNEEMRLRETPMACDFLRRRFKSLSLCFIESGSPLRLEKFVNYSIIVSFVVGAVLRVCMSLLIPIGPHWCNDRNGSITGENNSPWSQGDSFIWVVEC